MPFVARRASVRDVLPWSWGWCERGCLTVGGVVKHGRTGYKFFQDYERRRLRRELECISAGSVSSDTLDTFFFFPNSALGA